MQCEITMLNPSLCPLWRDEMTPCPLQLAGGYCKFFIQIETENPSEHSLMFLQHPSDQPLSVPITLDPSRRSPVRPEIWNIPTCKVLWCITSALHFALHLLDLCQSLWKDYHTVSPDLPRHPLLETVFFQGFPVLKHVHCYDTHH